MYLIIKYDFIAKTNFDIVHSMQLIYKMRVFYILFNAFLIHYLSTTLLFYLY